MTTEAFEAVYLGWKPTASEERYVVGIINKQQGDLTFQYIQEEVDRAIREGFHGYIDFPDIGQVYREYVLEIFSQRLTPKSRFKTASVFKFWEIHEKILQNKLATIAFTQAMLPTDNFEFLADFKPAKGLNFITDLSYTDSMNVAASAVDIDDSLDWVKEKDEHSSEERILIKYKSIPLGYVKRIHENVFNKYKSYFRLRVHSLEKRVTIKRVFVKVELL